MKDYVVPTDIFHAIQQERLYQIRKWGPNESHPHDVPGWLLIMQAELQEAIKTWTKHPGPLCIPEVLCEILQVVAVGVACMEQHGAMWREKLEVLKCEAAAAAGGE